MLSLTYWQTCANSSQQVDVCKDGRKRYGVTCIIKGSSWSRNWGVSLHIEWNSWGHSRSVEARTIWLPSCLLMTAVMNETRCTTLVLQFYLFFINLFSFVAGPPSQQFLGCEISYHIPHHLQPLNLKMVFVKQSRYLQRCQWREKNNSVFKETFLSKEKV